MVISPFALEATYLAFVYMQISQLWWLVNITAVKDFGDVLDHNPKSTLKNALTKTQCFSEGSVLEYSVHHTARNLSWTNHIPSKPTFLLLFHILKGTTHSHPNLKPNTAGTRYTSLSSTISCATRQQVPTSYLIKSGFTVMFLVNVASSCIILIIKDK